jgi:hypothetical protein
VAEDVINEKDTHFVDAAFWDQNDQPVTPDSASCRIDDVESGTEIRGWTAITPAGPTHEIEITPDENRILDASRRSERRRVTVTMTYATNRKKTSEHYYLVRNLEKVS